MPVVGQSGVPATIQSVGISGLAAVGYTLIATPVGAIGSPSPTVTYQWRSGAVIVPGAIAASYTLSEGDNGETVTVTATATNTFGSQSVSASVAVASDTSAPTSGGGAPPPTGGVGGGSIGDGDGNDGTNAGITDGAPFDPGDLDTGPGTETSFSMTNEGSGIENMWSEMKNLVEEVFTDLAGSAEVVEFSSMAEGGAIIVGEVGAGAAIEIEAFPAICFAAALLLGEYVFGWILEKVANLFPNPGVFGWHPLGFIKSGLANVGKALDKSAKDIAGDLLGIIITPIRQIVGLVQRLINLGNTAHGKAATLNNETIPQARHDAVVTAQAYTDQSVGNLQITEQQALANLRTTTTQAIATAKAEAILGAQSGLATLEQQLLQKMSDEEQQFAGLTTEVQVTMPAEIQQQVNDAIATENQKLTSTANNLQSNITTVQQQIAAQNETIAAAQSEIITAQNNINQLGAANTLDVQAIQTQQAVIAAAQGTIDNATTAIEELETQITGISTTLGNVQSAQQLNTAQLAPFEIAGAVGLATVLATLTSTLNNLKTKVDTCMVDNCDETNPNNIKNVLKTLLGAISAGAEIAFIAEAVHDPTGTANALAPTLDDIDSGAVEALDALLSL